MFPRKPPARRRWLLPTFTLSGVIFFDYSGNGVQEAHEPSIPGAAVQIGAFMALSGPDGSYQVQGLSRGKQEIRLSAPDFRYISISLEAFQHID